MLPAKPPEAYVYLHGLVGNLALDWVVPDDAVKITSSLTPGHG